MKKEHRPKDLAYSEKHKDMSVEGEVIIEALVNNHNDIFMIERGTCRVDDKPKEFMVLKIYFDIKDK